MSNPVHSFVVRGTFQVTHYIGKGSAGDVWRAFNLLTGRKIAVKTKAIPANGGLPQVLAYEAAIYKLLHGAPQGIPTVHWSGVDGNHFVIVMDVLGPNLDSLRKFCRGKFTVRTICMLAEQMLARVQFIHSRGVVSGDLKPHNFALGWYDKVQHVYLFDFSHAQLFINPTTGEHIPFREGRYAFGTALYASVSAHLGIEVSRRDDIESLLYVLIELYHGKLPWHNATGTDDVEVMDRILEMKAGPEFDDFLADSLPEFRAYLQHFTGLSFGEAPDYDLLRGLFRARMQAEGWSYDWKFDWEDSSALPAGTLIPEEYVLSLEHVDRIGLDF